MTRKDVFVEEGESTQLTLRTCIHSNRTHFPWLVITEIVESEANPV
jgi:hypothetical protein